MSQIIATTSSTTWNSTRTVDTVDAGTVSPGKAKPLYGIRTRADIATRVFPCQESRPRLPRTADVAQDAIGTFFANSTLQGTNSGDFDFHADPSAHESASTRIARRRLIVGPIPTVFCCTGLQYQIVN